MLAKEEPKEKREAPVGYPSLSGHSSLASSYQSPSLGHGDASAISVGAGYSIGGGAKPSYSFGGHGGGAALQYQSEGIPSGGQHTFQLAPITLQPNQDLSQIMSQLTQSLNSGALTLQPSNTVAEFHQSTHGSDQQVSYPQFSYGGAQQYALAGAMSGAPAYNTGTKGLGSYSSTGPVLFNPSGEHGSAAGLAVAQSAGHGDAGGLSYGGQSLAGLSFGGSGHSFSAPELSLGSSGLSLNGLAHSLSGSEQSLGGGSGHSLGSGGPSLGGSGYSFGGSGQSLGDHSQGGAALSLGSSGHSFGNGGHSYGGSGHSFGGSPNSLGAFYKVSSGQKYTPTKSAFKPSTFLGASVQSDSGLSSSHSYPGSFGSGGQSGLSFGGHGASFGGSFGGSSKGISPLYTKSFGSALDSAGAYSSSGHLASPPGTTYGFPTASYSGAVHAASSAGPQYYVSSSKFPSFGEGSSSYKSPISSYSSLSSHSSGPKYSFGGHSSSGSRYSSPKDSHGAYSEPVYNTIKYSQELKPRIH